MQCEIKILELRDIFDLTYFDVVDALYPPLDNFVEINKELGALDEFTYVVTLRAKKSGSVILRPKARILIKDSVRLLTFPARRLQISPSQEEYSRIITRDIGKFTAKRYREIIEFKAISPEAELTARRETYEAPQIYVAITERSNKSAKLRLLIHNSTSNPITLRKIELTSYRGKIRMLGSDTGNEIWLTNTILEPLNTFQLELILEKAEETRVFIIPILHFDNSQVICGAFMI